MKNQFSKVIRPNFTNISDLDLELKGKAKKLDPLFYYKVLKTRELFNRTNKREGIKNFRKWINKLEKMGLVGTIRENRFSEQFIYIKERLLQIDKGENWKHYTVHDESLESIKFHWQIGKMYRVFTQQGSHLRNDSYINTNGRSYDFKFELWGAKAMIYGLFAIFPWGEDEKAKFEDLRERIEESYITIPIFLTRDWDEILQRELSKHYFRSRWPRKVAWCHIKDSDKTKEDFLNAPLITIKESMSLGDFLNGEAERIDQASDEYWASQSRSEPKPKPKQRGFWESLKEVLN